jgi:hypothetical protein
MKGYVRRLALAASLLFWLSPLPSEAQTRGEERIETGRFGAEEPEGAETAGGGEAGPYDSRLYLGLRTGPSLRIYTPSGDVPYTGGDTQGFATDTAFQARVRLLPFLSLQGEAVFTWDNAAVWDYREGAEGSAESYTRDFRSYSLRFPLTARLDFYPGDFQLSPFLGAYYILPLGDIQHTDSPNNIDESLSYGFSPPWGLTGGLRGALKLGPGLIFAELRCAVDLGEPEPEGGAPGTYRRSMVTLGLGYELGFFPKKRNGNHE